MIHFASIAQMQNANAYLRNQIEQAKLQQNDYHQQQLMYFNERKMNIERQIQSEKLEFDRYKFEQGKLIQQEQMKAQIEVAQIQADSQEEQVMMKNENDLALAAMNIIGTSIKQSNDLFHIIVSKSLDEKMAQNQHERQKELLKLEAELKIQWAEVEAGLKKRQMKLQQKHDIERSLFEHNARVLEQVLGQKLKELSNKINLMDKFSYEKFEQNIADIVQKVLSMQPEKRLNEYDEEIGRAADKLARSVYSPY